MVKDIADFSSYGEIEDSITSVFMQYEDGKVVSISGPMAKIQYAVDEDEEDDDADPVAAEDFREIAWVTDLTKFTQAKSVFFAAYGNCAGISHTYGNVCLLLHVGPAGSRSERLKEPEMKKRWGW